MRRAEEAVDVKGAYTSSTEAPGGMSGLFAARKSSHRFAAAKVGGAKAEKMLPSMTQPIRTRVELESVVASYRLKAAAAAMQRKVNERIR